MYWKHVPSPAKGIITNALPANIPQDASPYARGVYMKDGKVISDFGYVNFPTPGATKTNFLNGSVMMIKQLPLTTGLNYLVALTTTNAYLYNTSTLTWDNITNGTTVEDCEDDWVASANVTSAAQTTYKLKGTKAIKVAIAAGFTTGVAAYEDISSADLSAKTALHFWIYSSVALVAADYSIRLSEEIAGGTGATYVDFDLPAVAANTWTPCSVTGTFTDLNAVLSVALIVNTDKGAVDIYIDDIKAVNAFTGDEDNRFSATIMNNTLIVTNGIDQPQKYTGSGSFTDLTTTLAAGTISTAELVFTFKDHLVLLNNTENGADAPQRASWTNIGQLEDWITGTAGYQDLVDDTSWIIAILILSENVVIIYKEDSIVSMEWIGGHTPFRFKTLYNKSGAISKNSVVLVRGSHIVCGTDMVYGYTGGLNITPIDTSIKGTLYSRLNKQYSGRSFMFFEDEDDELQIWIPTDTEYPDDGWCLNVATGAWYRKQRTILCTGDYKSASSKTIGDLIGTIGEQNWRFGDALIKAYSPVTLVGDNSGNIYQIDKTTLNNAGVAIINEFQTPDFILPESEENLNRFMRVTQLLIEASGQSITTSYSTDGGVTWNATQSASSNTIALVSTPTIYQQDFDVTTRKIRFKFHNNSVSSGFSLSYYAFYWILRSGRR